MNMAPQHSDLPLDRYRSYLLFLARLQLDSRAQNNLDRSEMVLKQSGRPIATLRTSSGRYASSRPQKTTRIHAWFGVSHVARNVS